MTSTLTFASSQRDRANIVPGPRLQRSLDLAFWQGLIYLGPAYVAWSVWQRRRRPVTADTAATAPGA